MSEIVVEAKELSKKYLLYHEAQGAYSTIVDSLTRGSKRFFQKLFKPSTFSTRTFEEFWALTNVSFTLYEGDRIGIIGENGAGKSTLLKILSRIIEPSSGSVSIKGRIASLLEVGTGFHPELTGRENIFLNGAILGMAKSEIIKRFDEIIAFSEIEKFLDTPVKYYSSGMYARLGFAIAAHLDPDILIVDEVLSVGDARFQEKCLKKLNTVSQSGRTILFVSHNSQALSALCNKGILLEKGQVTMAGGIDACLNKYLKESKHNSFLWEGCVGSPALQVTKVSLDHTLDFFYQNEMTTVTITCEVFEIHEEGLFGIEIKNNRGQTVLHSFLKRINLNIGKYNLALDINLEMLWEGEYTLHVNYVNKQVICFEAITLRFPVFPIPSEHVYIDKSSLGGMNYMSPWKIQACHAQ